MLVPVSGLALVRRLLRVYVPHWSKQQQRAASRRGKSKKNVRFYKSISLFRLLLREST